MATLKENSGKTKKLSVQAPSLLLILESLFLFQCEGLRHLSIGISVDVIKTWIRDIIIFASRDFFF